MSLLNDLYVHETDAEMIWKKFPLLDPKLPYLKKEYLRSAMLKGEQDFPLDAFRFTLFPERSDEEVNSLFYGCMQKGRNAINVLLEEHLDAEQAQFFKLPELGGSFDLSCFIGEAFRNRENSFTGKKDPKADLTLQAYNSLRAVELGYRVGTIEECPLVLNAVQHFLMVKQRLEGLLAFTEEREEENLHSWETSFGVRVFSPDKIPMHTRVKSLGQDQAYTPRYSSILMKIYKEREFAEEIKDYIGAEFIVRNNQEREAFVRGFRRKTRPIGQFERYKDLSRRRAGSVSSTDLTNIKFILRVPIEVQRVIHSSSLGSFYERVPVEIQVLTIQDHLLRTEQTQATHQAYKRRQFLEVFPALFPRRIYEPI